MSVRIPRRGRRGSMAPLVEWSPPSLFRHPGRRRPDLSPEAFDLRANRPDLRQGQLADGTPHIHAVGGQSAISAAGVTFLAECGI